MKKIQFDSKDKEWVFYEEKKINQKKEKSKIKFKTFGKNRKKT